MIAGVVLAAGAGRRFGGPKQLHRVEGSPMLERVLAALERSGVEPRIVVLGARAEDVRAGVALHGAQAVLAERWEDGQAASLRAGLAALPDAAEAAVVVLGDGPGLHPEAVRRLLAARSGGRAGVLAADYGHGRSHPVLIPRARFDAMPERGETPGRHLEVELVDCRGLAEPGDVDYAP